MSTNRFITRHEYGADWAVIDAYSKAIVASGLSEEEADEAAKARNSELEKSQKSS